MEERLPSSSLVQVGGKQERFCWRVPVPGDDGNGMQCVMDPGDEAQARVGGIQTDDARTQSVEAHGPLKPRASEGGIMDIGRGEQKEDRQARAATEQGMDAIAA